MKLWIFGDSYSADGRKDASGKINWQNIDKSWIELLQEKLNIPVVTVYAAPGVANEWIFSNVLEHRASFTSDDYVVVQLTCSLRRWFFEDRPWTSNFLGAGTTPDLSKNEKKALEFYRKYLINRRADISNYRMMEMALKSVALDVNAPSILVIPGFDPIQGIKGTLGDICFGEFDDPNLIGKYYAYHNFDPRINHMHEENHKILANKIFNYFQTWQEIDLTSGFKNKFINSSNYKQNNQLTS